MVINDENLDEILQELEDELTTFLKVTAHVSLVESTECHNHLLDCLSILGKIKSHDQNSTPAN